MKILFALFGRLGDICCGIPNFIALREKYPNDELSWITSAQYAPLVPTCGNSIIDNDVSIYAQDNNKITQWSKYYDKVINAQPSWRHTEWTSNKIHVIDLISKWCDVKLKSRKIIINSSNDDKNYVNSLKLPKKFITICTGPSHSVKDYWPIASRQKIIKMIGLPSICIGGKDGVGLNGAINLCGKLSFTQSVEVINKSVLYIGQDTGTSWLACATNAPKLCIIDKNRLKTGLVGFKGYVEGNITDMFVQDGDVAIINQARRMLK